MCIRDRAYIALFICMVTKAIHLELVSDLTSDAFIAALKRFIVRRGIPDQICSDNGTNFRRASSTLHELYKRFYSNGFERTTQDFTSAQGIKWFFIPPSAPHFGGLWKAESRASSFICGALSAEPFLRLRNITLS